MEMRENEHFWDAHSVVCASRKEKATVQDNQENAMKSRTFLN